MHRTFLPNTVSTEGLVEQAQDTTAPDGMVFHHASEGKPLATPWQVASIRAGFISQHRLPEGWILDCACGSGIQLAAYAMALQRPVLGIELDEQRAQASAVNLTTVAKHEQVGVSWLEGSRIVAGDGTDPDGVLASLGAPSDLIAMLHLDPARPRNSRTHALAEMQPPLHSVLQSWAPFFAPDHPPAVLLDLSPRLTSAQREEVEAIVDGVWPNIARTWEWMSRGRGSVDRLGLWLGGLATPETMRRFVRVPPRISQKPLVLTCQSEVEESALTVFPPKRGEYVSILDAALVESGLAETWLSTVSKDSSFRWNFLEGRRPQVHHDHALRLNDEESRLLQATGRVVELIKFTLDETTVDRLVEVALEHNMASLKLRFDLAPELQPILQGSLDRQLRRRHGQRHGFVAQHPNGEVLLLCAEHAESKQ